MKKRRLYLGWHDIYKLIDDDLMAVMRVRVTKGKNAEYTDFQGYAFDLFSLLTEISSNFDDLDHSVLFMSSFPSIKSWRSKMERKDYLAYHMESYYASIVGIFDRILHLINFVYDLGLHPVHVKLDILLKNSRVPAKIKTTLRKFDKYLQESELKERRNRASHVGRPHLPEFSRPAQFATMARIADAKVDRLKYKRAATALYRERIGLKKKELKEHKLKVMDFSWQILDDIYQPVKKKRETSE